MTTVKKEPVKRTAGNYKKPRHDVPRTSTAAVAAKFTKSKTTPYNELTTNQKTTWIGIASGEARHICGVRTLPNGRVKVCYIDPNTGECNDCYDAPPG